ncbi:PPC domain-containing DNA-binding protein [Usitatibacter rugosus]|uniref:PPC domain-containing DNA-binding protein n=1 Tax=Usitatibacter rugosus TaxID=2732067 RepID=UPI001BB2054F|nr:PPC domain-containing DNA-binding protein [Usitatibacter rugosus]
MSAPVEVVRLSPGADLRAELVRVAAERHLEAAFVLTGIGSLDPAVLRFAGNPEATVLRGDYEILTLAGTLGTGGVHLHMSVSDSKGQVLGGHVAAGCIVRTTAEIVIGRADGWTFDRPHDPATGFRELDPRRKP